MLSTPKRRKGSISILFVLAFASLICVPVSAQAAGATCEGSVATISSSARVIYGTTGDDVIVVQGGGVHTVYSGAGDDVICGSSGKDTINGSEGDDTINAGAGNDIVNSGTGEDNVAGNSGNDVISAGPGDDKVAGGVGDDTLKGFAGSDSLAGGTGNDTIAGGAGADRLTGNSGSDSLAGEAGNDTLQGGLGKDIMSAGSGTNYCATDATDSMIGSCSIDNSGPEMSNVSVPSTVQAGSAVTFIWSVNEAAGVDSSWVKIGGPSGWVTTWCGFGLQGTRISGTAQAAVFSATCQVPENAVNTEYTAFFDASDVFGQNAQSSSANFRVTGGATDASAPVISQLSLSSPTLTYGETLDITFTADDETGMSGAIAWIAHNGYGFANHEGRSYIDYGVYNIRTSGDAKSGTYRQQISLNSFAPTGEYTLWISVIDTLGNKVFYQTDTKFTVN
jgi:hypothetical protein